MIFLGQGFEIKVGFVELRFWRGFGEGEEEEEVGLECEHFVYVFGLDWIGLDWGDNIFIFFFTLADNYGLESNLADTKLVNTLL